VGRSAVVDAPAEPKVIRFINNLTHTKGEWAGQPFNLRDWQVDILDKLFNTLLPDGRRQYRTCYIEIPRKNGKTELAAAIALYMLLGDDEPDGKKLFWRPSGVRPAELELYGVRNIDGAPIVVVAEGEKAADALRERGIAAVGTVTGAAAIPCDEALRPLLGRRVLLWPDADDPGRRHMDAIAARLRALGHDDIKIVRWTDAPAGGDAADYDGDDGELRALLDAAVRAAADARPRGAARRDAGVHRV
jgi:hypothetical protein